jgi:GTPase Era involved in 16S rRNA processing
MASSNGDSSFRRDDLLPPSVDFESLRQYTSLKLSIANQLRNLRDLLRKRENGASVQSCERLMAKLAEDQFTIAILGQFIRGKSTLLNAIIGRDLLPTGILPVTSVVTIVKFGARERLVVQRKGFQFPQHEPIDALKNCVTQQHNPENQDRIESVTIELPLPLLRRGLQFIDTPGVGSAIRAHTEATYSFLPNCDAVLFVTGADGALSEAELKLLSSIKRYAGKMFFVLNKVDLLADENGVIRVGEFIKSVLSRELGISKINLIPVSAKKGLEASLRESGSQFARSGLLYLEETLARFLATERETVFLKAVIDGARRLLGRELNETELIDRANQVGEAERCNRFDAIKAECTRLKTERFETLQTIREGLVKHLFGPTSQELSSCLSAESDKAIRWLDVYLRKGGARAAVSVTRRYSKRTARRFWTCLSHWMTRNEQSLARRMNAIIRNGLERLRLNLNDLSILPSKMFGLPVVEPPAIDEEFGALLLRPKFGIAFAEGWSPTIPWSLRFWPTVAVRRWLRNRLRSQLLTFVNNEHEVALNAIQKNVDEVLEALSARVSEYATDLEERATAILSGRQGRLEEDFQYKKVPTYRNELLVLDRNFYVLQEQLQAPRQICFAPSQPPLVGGFRAGSAPPVCVGVASGFTVRSCPVCEHLVNLSKEFFARFQYSLYNNERQQESFAMSGGFCSFHMWQLEAFSSPVGFSIGCAKLVRRISVQLGRTATSPEVAKESLKELLDEPKSCQVCALLREAERTQTRRLSASLLDGETRMVYTRSQGACLRHLEMLIEASSDEGTISFLLETASIVLQLISEDMEGFALKREATRRHLASEDEEDAYLRAVIHLAGARQNCVPWTYRHF